MPVTITYARMRTIGPCLMWHASVHSGPHSSGPSDSCPLLTGSTVCGAELKCYILEKTLLNPYSRRDQLSYTPSVANPLLISYESHTSRQKHQTLTDPHFNRITRHTDGTHSPAPLPLISSTSRLYNLGKFSSGCCCPACYRVVFWGPLRVDCARHRCHCLFK